MEAGGDEVFHPCTGAWTEERRGGWNFTGGDDGVVGGVTGGLVVVGVL